MCDTSHSWMVHYTFTTQAMEGVEAKYARHVVEADEWRARAAALRALNVSLTHEEALSLRRRGNV